MDRRLSLLIPVTFFIALFLGVESGGFQLVLLQMAKDFGLDPVRMGGVVTSQFTAIFLGPLLSGWISDRIGKKSVLLFGMAVFIAGCLGASLAPGALYFTWAVFIVGLGYSVCELTASTILSDSFPGRESRYLNIMQAGFSLGAVLSPLVFSRLIGAGLVTWRSVFLTSGGAYILILPLLCVSRYTRPNVRPSPENINREEGNVTGNSGPVIFSPFFIALVFTMMIYIAIETGAGYFANSIFVSEYGNTELGAYAISGFWFSITVSRFAFSRIKMKPRAMIMAGFLMVSLFMGILLPVKNHYALLVLFFLLGIAVGPVWPMIIGIGASLNQKRSGTNTGILYASGGLGGIIIPVLIGFIAKYQGFYAGFWMLAIFSAAGFLVLWLGAKK